MKYLRLSDLIARNRFNNGMTCRRHIKAGLFDPGFLISPGMRVWTEDRIELYDDALRAASAAGLRDMATMSAFVRAYVAEFDATQGDFEAALTAAEKAARKAAKVAGTVTAAAPAEHAGAA